MWRRLYSPKSSSTNTQTDRHVDRHTDRQTDRRLDTSHTAWLLFVSDDCRSLWGMLKFTNFTLKLAKNLVSTWLANKYTSTRLTHLGFNWLCVCTISRQKIKQNFLTAPSPWTPPSQTSPLCSYIVNEKKLLLKWCKYWNWTEIISKKTL